MTDILYNDDTKLKDLTVGQLKDIIIETISGYNFSSFERRQYIYSPGYEITQKPVYPNPISEPYCGDSEGIQY